MADYKDIISGTFGKVVGKVREAADSTGVLEIYAQGADRAKALGRVAKLSLDLNGEYEELGRVYKEIGRLYYEQAKDAPEGFFVPLFEQAGRINAAIRDKQSKIEEAKAVYTPEDREADIDVQIGDFDDVVSATEADGMTVEIKTEE